MDLHSWIEFKYMKKKSLLLIALLTAGLSSMAQRVEFHVNEGLSNTSLKSRIEWNISTFLQTCNSTFAGQGSLQFPTELISDDAAKSVQLLWNNMPFRCGEEKVIERILHTYAGYQIRNIPIVVSC